MIEPKNYQKTDLTGSYKKPEYYQHLDSITQGKLKKLIDNFSDWQYKMNDYQLNFSNDIIERWRKYGPMNKFSIHQINYLNDLVIEMESN